MRRVFSVVLCALVIFTSVVVMYSPATVSAESVSRVIFTFPNTTGWSAGQGGTVSMDTDGVMLTNTGGGYAFMSNQPSFNAAVKLTSDGARFNGDNAIDALNVKIKNTGAPMDLIISIKSAMNVDWNTRFALKGSADGFVYYTIPMADFYVGGDNKSPKVFETGTTWNEALASGNMIPDDYDIFSIMFNMVSSVPTDELIFAEMAVSVDIDSGVKMRTASTFSSTINWNVTQGGVLTAGTGGITLDNAGGTYASMTNVTDFMATVKLTDDGQRYNGSNAADALCVHMKNPGPTTTLWVQYMAGTAVDFRAEITVKGGSSAYEPYIIPLSDFRIVAVPNDRLSVGMTWAQAEATGQMNADDYEIWLMLFNIISTDTSVSLSFGGLSTVNFTSPASAPRSVHSFSSAANWSAAQGGASELTADGVRLYNAAANFGSMTNQPDFAATVKLTSDGARFNGTNGADAIRLKIINTGAPMDLIVQFMAATAVNWRYDLPVKGYSPLPVYYTIPLSDFKTAAASTHFDMGVPWDTAVASGKMTADDYDIWLMLFNLLTPTVGASLTFCDMSVVYTRQYFVTPNPSLSNGSLTSNAAAAKVGESVEVTVSPAEGYMLKGGILKYRDGTGKVCPVYKKSSSGKLTFTMPASNVVLLADFVAENGADPTERGQAYVQCIGQSYLSPEHGAALQFGSRVAKTAVYNGVTYTVKSFGTYLIQTSTPSFPVSPDTYTGWEAFYQSNQSTVHKIAAVSLVDDSTSYYDYTARVEDISADDADIDFTAVAYADYAAEEQPVLRLYAKTVSGSYNSNAAPDHQLYHYAQSEFMLSSFMSFDGDTNAEKNQRIVKNTRNAGLNLIEATWLGSPASITAALDAADAVGGISILAQNARGTNESGTDLGGISNSHLPQSVTAAGVNSWVNQIRNYKSLYGYFVWDEPASGSFLQASLLTKLYRAADPKRLAYSCIFPSYGSYTWPASYPAYVDSYISTVKPQVLSFDYYPFQGGTGSIATTNDLWRDFGYLRKKALENDIPLWYYFQAKDGNTPLSVERIKTQMSCALAYGVKGLSYYTGVNVLTNIDGTVTAEYQALKAVNLRVRRIGDLLFGKENQALYHTGLDISYDTTYNLDSLTSSPYIASAPANLAIGVFTGGGKTYLVAANKDHTTAASGTLTLTNSTAASQFNPDNGTQTDLGTLSSLSLSIEAGGIAVYVLG